MARLDWGSISSHLSSLGEDLGAGQSPDSDSEDISEEEMAELEAQGLAEDADEDAGPLSGVQLAVLAEMLGINTDELLGADDAMIAEAMEFVAQRVLATKYSEEYGRPGLTGRYPWDANEAPIGMTHSAAMPSMDGPPGVSRAVPPNAGTSPVGV